MSIEETIAMLQNKNFPGSMIQTLLDSQKFATSVMLLGRTASDSKIIIIIFMLHILISERDDLI